MAGTNDIKEGVHPGNGHHFSAVGRNMQGGQQGDFNPHMMAQGAGGNGGNPNFMAYPQYNGNGTGVAGGEYGVERSHGNPHEGNYFMGGNVNAMSQQMMTNPGSGVTNTKPEEDVEGKTAAARGHYPFGGMHQEGAQGAMNDARDPSQMSGGYIMPGMEGKVDGMGGFGPQGIGFTAGMDANHMAMLVGQNKQDYMGNFYFGGQGAHGGHGGIKHDPNMMGSMGGMDPFGGNMGQHGAKNFVGYPGSESMRANPMGMNPGGYQMPMVNQGSGYMPEAGGPNGAGMNNIYQQKNPMQPGFYGEPSAMGRPGHSGSMPYGYGFNKPGFDGMPYAMNGPGNESIFRVSTPINGDKNAGIKGVEGGFPFTMKEKREIKQIGTLTPEERQQKIERYREKRKRRVWEKKIAYDCRKRVADNRLRIKGRFITKDEAARLLRSKEVSDPEMIKALKRKTGQDVDEKSEEASTDKDMAENGTNENFQNTDVSPSGGEAGILRANTTDISSVARFEDQRTQESNNGELIRSATAEETQVVSSQERLSGLTLQPDTGVNPDIGIGHGASVENNLNSDVQIAAADNSLQDNSAVINQVTTVASSGNEETGETIARNDAGAIEGEGEVEGDPEAEAEGEGEAGEEETPTSTLADPAN